MGATYGRYAAALATLAMLGGEAVRARGFGGGGFHAGGFSAGGFGGGGGDFRAGGFSAGGFSAGGFGGFGGSAERAGSYGGGSFSGERNFGGFSSPWGGAAGGSYDRSYSGQHGGSVDVSGSRGAAYGPWGGAVGGSTRDVSATGPEGRTYDNDTSRGFASGPFGGFAAGGTRSAYGSGPGGSFASSDRWGAAGYRFPGDAGLSRYTIPYGGAARASTYHWSAGATAVRADDVRRGFEYYGSFTGGWYAAHPGAWYPANWAARDMAWNAATWGTVAATCAIAAPPVNYDYGSTVVYQGDDVTVNGAAPIPAPQYAQQAADIAQAGTQANPAPQDVWQPVGVFALVQGNDKSSDNVLQLAVDSNGILRGNYYDGVMDSTSPVAGSIDPKTQRAAWTVGKKAFPVFEAGAWNLTQAQSPVLVHFSKDRSQQWLLVRVKQPNPGNGGTQSPAPAAGN